MLAFRTEKTYILASDFKILLSKVGPTLDLHEKGLETELEAENRGNRYTFSRIIRIRRAFWQVFFRSRSILLFSSPQSRCFAKNELKKSQSKINEISF